MFQEFVGALKSVGRFIANNPIKSAALGAVAITGGAAIARTGGAAIKGALGRAANTVKSRAQQVFKEAPQPLKSRTDLTGIQPKTDMLSKVTPMTSTKPVGFSELNKAGYLKNAPWGAMGG